MKSTHPNKDLTIVSVNHTDKMFLDANYRLTTSLNSHEDFIWLVVDNAPEANEKMDQADTRFHIIDGVPPVQKEHIGSAAYHVSAALNKGLQNVQTRFALFLHPDCYIVRPQWIKAVLEHMQNKRLSFFGTPCHPQKITSYRYFPYIACLFVDLGRVKREQLDFTPEIDELRALRTFNPRALMLWWLTGRRPAQVKNDINPDKKYIFDMLKRLWINKYITPKYHFVDAWVGSSGDVGSRVYRRFIHDRKHKYEYTTPVWKIEQPAATSSVKQKSKESLIRFFLPDSLSAIPKKKGYTSSLTFSELGFYNVENAFDCEPYLWQGKPFCFHIRRVGQWIKSKRFKGDTPAEALQQDIPAEILNKALGSFLH